MLTGLSIQRVYLACGATDLRKSIDSLAVLVKEGFKLDPFSSALFVFCNRRRDKLKILHWEHKGFWLYYRRLEKGTFRWPNNNQEMITITARQLRWLLDGLPLELKQAHPEVKERVLL